MKPHWLRASLFLLWILSAVYLAQNLFMPLRGMDEAQQAGILDLIVSGQLPHRDFLDIYGPLSWLPPALAYDVFGQKWIGVRIWMWLILLITIALSYRLARSLSNPFYAAACCGLMAVLFGARWSFHYTAYASTQLYPVILGIAYLLLEKKAKTSKWSLIGAGGLTAIALLTKTNVGVFILAAGLFYCFYFKPSSQPPLFKSVRQLSSARQQGILFIKWIGLGVYGSVFTIFVLPHYEKQYFWHLLAPLYLGLCIAGWVEKERAYSLTAGSHWKMTLFQFRQWTLYGGSVLFSSLILLLACYPSGMATAYLDLFPRILKEVNYAYPFGLLAPTGSTPLLLTLSGWYWAQLPWLVFFLIVGVGIGKWFRQEHAGWSHRYRWSSQEFPQFIGLCFLTFLGHYVIYPLPDMGHLFQDYALWLVLFAVVLFHFERCWLAGNIYRQTGMRLLVLTLFVVWSVPLLQLPLKGSNYQWRTENPLSLSPKVDYLHFYPEPEDRISREYMSRMVTYLHTHLNPGDEFFVLSTDELLYLYAGLPRYGGRDHYLFYLLKHSRLPRKGFDALVSAETWNRLLDSPPRFMLDMESPLRGSLQIKNTLPEIQNMLKTRYRPVLTYKSAILYEYQSEAADAP